MKNALIAAATIYFLAGFMLILSASVSFGAKLFFVFLHIALCIIIALIYRNITEKRKIKSSESSSKKEQKQSESSNKDEKQEEEQIILQQDRKPYIQQKASDIASQIKAQRITISYIGIHICFNDKKNRRETYIEYNTYRNAYDPWEYCGELSLNLPAKTITEEKEAYRNEDTIKNAFYAEYSKKTEAFYLAKEINKHFDNTFDISESYEYRPLADSRFTYSPVKVSVILTK